MTHPSEKEYVELVRKLAHNVFGAHHGHVAASLELIDCAAKVEKWWLKLSSPADVFARAGSLQKELAANEVEVATIF